MSQPSVSTRVRVRIVDGTAAIAVAHGCPFHDDDAYAEECPW